MNEDVNKLYKKIGLGVVLGVIFIVMLVLAVSGIEIIHAGNRGIKLVFGKVVGEALTEGIYFINPITTKIVEMNVQEQKVMGETASYTKDTQQVQVKYAVNYYPDKEKAHILYRDLGVHYADKIIPPLVEANIKNIIGTINADTLVEKRAWTIDEMEKLLKVNLEPRNIVLVRFTTTDYQFEKEYERAIEAKVVAIQRAIEAQNKVKQADYEAQAVVLKATGDAKAIQVRADALKQNAKLVEYEAVQKWDGVLPKFMFGNSTPFINLGDTVK